jgi:hypothetical protein
LTTLYLANAKNTDSWHARKWDLQRASPLDVLMVLSSSITITTDGECLTCGGFSLSKTIHFGSLEFLIDRLGGMSLSPMGDGSDVIAMGSARGGPLLPQWTMTRDSDEWFSSRCSDGSPCPLQPRPYRDQRTLWLIKLQQPFHHGRRRRGWTSTSPSSDGALVKRPHNNRVS